MVQDKTLAGMQGCDFLCVSNSPEKVTVPFRAAVLPVMRQGQPLEALFLTKLTPALCLNQTDINLLVSRHVDRFVASSHQTML